MIYQQYINEKSINDTCILLLHNILVLSHAVTCQWSRVSINQVEEISTFKASYCHLIRLSQSWGHVMYSSESTQRERLPQISAGSPKMYWFLYRTHNVSVCLYIAYIACGSASLYIKTLYSSLTVLALSAAANIKIRYDAKIPQFAIFGTRVICVFYSNDNGNDNNKNNDNYNDNKDNCIRVCSKIWII